MTFDLLEVVSISEMDSTVTLQFYLSLSWRDPGLTFLNLKGDPASNRLSEDAAKTIWTPKVIHP